MVLNILIPLHPPPAPFELHPLRVPRAINSMCSMMGFNASIQAAIIDSTMQAGVHGAAVSMWAMSMVLCLMEKKAQDDETLLRVSGCVCLT